MKKTFILISLSFLILGCNSQSKLSASNESISSDIVSSESSSSVTMQSTSNDLKPPKIPTISSIDKTYNIYINPSVQTRNMYYDKVTTEAEIMNKISKEIVNNLSNIPYLNVYYNDRYLSLSKSVSEINKLNIDYHLALHSNAGGGSGSECYHYKSEAFAKSILTSFNQMHSFPNRGVKDGSHLYELNSSKAKNKILIEFLFHDNAQEGSFLKTKYKEIADNVSKTLITYINLCG